MVRKEEQGNQSDAGSNVREKREQDVLQGPWLPVVGTGKLDERRGVEKNGAAEGEGQQERGEGLFPKEEQVDRDDEGEYQGGEPDGRERIQVEPWRERDTYLLSESTHAFQPCAGGVASIPATLPRRQRPVHT
jgi:hypothetical protein